MPKYRVTLRVSSVEIIEADNPFMAAVAVSQQHGFGVEIVDVRPAAGRIARSSTKPSAKKRKPMSAETRAKLARNLEKARAARAKKLHATKRVTKKRA